MSHRTATTTILNVVYLVRFAVSVFCMALLMTACGGGSGSSGSSNNSSTNNTSLSSNSTNASPGGIYSGTIFLNGAQRTDPLVGVVTETGEGEFLDTYDGGVYKIQFTVQGNSSTGSFYAYLSGNGPYTLFPNGTVNDSGTQSSTIVERQSISGTYNTPTDVGSFSLTNQSTLYEAGSSLASLTGSYPTGQASYRIMNDRFANTSMALTIHTDASFTVSSSCTFAGQVSIIDVKYNAYRVGGSATCGYGGVSSGFLGLGFLTPSSGTSTTTFTIIAPASSEYFGGIASQ